MVSIKTRDKSKATRRWWALYRRRSHGQNCDPELTILTEQHASFKDIARSLSILFFILTSVQIEHLNYSISAFVSVNVTALSESDMQPVHQNLTPVTLGQRSCGMSVIQCASGDHEPPEKLRPQKFKSCSFLFFSSPPSSKSVKVCFFHVAMQAALLVSDLCGREWGCREQLKFVQ